MRYEENRRAAGVKIAPSILSADFSRLKEEISEVERAGAEYLHLDVMDGLFVPNITIGVPVVRSVRRITDMVLDVHLMIVKPGRYVGDFVDAGADILVFHLEADEPQNIMEAVSEVKSRGKKVGLSIKPRTPAEFILPYLSLLDLVLVMTVEPGFSNQKFMAEQLRKVEDIRRMIDSAGLDCELEVDGGINPHTAKLCVEAGADVLVAGSAVFDGENRGEMIRRLRGEWTK